MLERQRHLAARLGTTAENTEAMKSLHDELIPLIEKYTTIAFNEG